jgi:hypothetical protein
MTTINMTLNMPPVFDNPYTSEFKNDFCCKTTCCSILFLIIHPSIDLSILF